MMVFPSSGNCRAQWCGGCWSLREAKAHWRGWASALGCGTGWTVEPSRLHPGHHFYIVLSHQLGQAHGIGAEEVGAQFSIAASFVFPPFGWTTWRWAHCASSSADLPGVGKCPIVTHWRLWRTSFKYLSWILYIYIFYSPIVLVNKMDIYHTFSNPFITIITPCQILGVSEDGTSGQFPSQSCRPAGWSLGSSKARRGPGSLLFGGAIAAIAAIDCHS